MLTCGPWAVKETGERVLSPTSQGEPRLTKGGQLRWSPRCGDALLLLVSYCWPQRLIGPPERRSGSLTAPDVIYPAEGTRSVSIPSIRGLSLPREDRPAGSPGTRLAGTGATRGRRWAA